jgi:hypothetical protein
MQVALAQFLAPRPDPLKLGTLWLWHDPPPSSSVVTTQCAAG